MRSMGLCSLSCANDDFNPALLTDLATGPMFICSTLALPSPLRLFVILESGCSFPAVQNSVETFAVVIVLLYEPMLALSTVFFGYFGNGEVIWSFGLIGSRGSPAVRSQP